MADIFTAENPVFVVLGLCGVVLLLKMVAMAFVTSFYRKTKKIFANPEDVRMADPSGKKELKPSFQDEDVERVRRAHRNDMENIYLFLFNAFLYVTTHPLPSTAILLFVTFTISRVCHSIVYVSGVRQPARGLCYLVGVVVNVIMAVSVLVYYGERLM